MLRLIILSLALTCSPLYASEPDERTRHEISHLIEYIESSPCRFNRNGSWYAASEAAAHIKKKYKYALGRGLVHSAEDFIKFAATGSSLSGQEYLVKCGVSEAAPVSNLLYEELEAFRSPGE